MKKLKLLAKGILLVLAVQISFLSYNFPVSAASNHDACSVFTVTEEAHPLSDDIGWKYKTVNGKIYKRLYNYSKRQWIGDWILVS